MCQNALLKLLAGMLLHFEYLVARKIKDMEVGRGRYAYVPMRVVFLWMASYSD